jgi:Polymer-forming cytoskeletal
VQAHSIVVNGRVDGTLYGTKHVDLKKSAVLVGDIYTSRIAIEEGASLRGSVLVQKDIPALLRKKVARAASITEPMKNLETWVLGLLLPLPSRLSQTLLEWTGQLLVRAKNAVYPAAALEHSR